MLAAAALIAAQAHAATGPWRKAESPHFVIYSQESASSLRTFAEKLELFDATLRYMYPIKSSDAAPSTDRLTIYSLGDAAAVQRVMGKGSTNVYGVYRPSITGSLALTARERADGSNVNTQIVLLHEYTHHFMLQNFAGAYPTWFVEGFAEFMSTARFESDSVGVGAPAMHRADELFAPWQVSWPRLLADDLGKGSGADRSMLYGRGWLLTHMLEFEPKRSGQLGRYLQAINDGTPAAKAADKAFGDLRQMSLELDNYLHRQRMSYLSIKKSALHPSAVTINEISPAESAIIPVRIESKYGVDTAEAQHLVPLARTAAARYANEPVAQCMLAEAEDDAGNFAEADAAADRLLAADPKQYCGLLYKGQIAIHRAVARKAGADDKEWGTARAWLSKANRAEIENPLPMYLYYTTYRAAKVKPSANATDALIGAALRAPQDSGARVGATIELLRRHDPGNARAMLGPVANSAHSDAGLFLVDVYHRIGTEPDDAVADLLANGPPKDAAKAASPASH